MDLDFIKGLTLSVYGFLTQLPAPNPIVMLLSVSVIDAVYHFTPILHFLLFVSKQVNLVNHWSTGDFIINA